MITWLICAPEGSLFKGTPDSNDDIWNSCDGQEDRKCAEKCYTGYFSGAHKEWEADSDYWTDWVSRRQAHLRQIVNLVDKFIAPAQYLLERFQKRTFYPCF